MKYLDRITIARPNLREFSYDGFAFASKGLIQSNLDALCWSAGPALRSGYLQLLLLGSTPMASYDVTNTRGAPMGINTEREIEANLQIGPTDQGMVRVYVFAGDLEIPMDFEPEEVEEIIEELRSALTTARDVKK